MTPELRAFAGGPLSRSAVMSWALAALALSSSAPTTTSVLMTTCTRSSSTMRCSSRHRRAVHGRGVLERLVDGLGVIFALPLGHHRGRNRVADHVGCAAAHVEKVVDAQDQQHPGFPNI